MSTGALREVWRTRRNCGGDPPFCGANCGTRSLSNFLRRTPCAVANGGHRTLPPSHQREGRKAGSQRVSGIRQERRSTLRLRSGRRPGDGVGGVREPAGSRWASPIRLKPRASWCSYHREALTNASASTPAQPEPGRGPSSSRFAGGDPGPDHRRFAGGVTGTRDTAGLPEVSRSEGRLVLIPPGDSHTPVDVRLAERRPGPSWMDVPHRDSGRGVGPVTGSAGSDRQCGRGGRHLSASKPRAS